MDSKKIKYDDVVLMQYADGELDKSEYLRLKKDLQEDKELQDRLAVFALTRDDLIATKMKLPKHIENLIDEQERMSEDEKIISFSKTRNTHSNSTKNIAAKQDNIINNFFKKYPIQSLAASVMFGLLIGSQGMKSLYDSPYNDILINNPTNEYQSVSKSIEIPLTRGLSQRSENNSSKTAIILLKMLKADVNFLPASDANKSISIITKFKNTQGYQCRLAESGGAYLVACKNITGNWSVHQPK